MEICDNSQDCVNKQRQSEKKIVSFYNKKADEPGYANLAFNVCSPLYEYQPSNKVFFAIGKELNKAEELGTVYDFNALLECISDTYKKAVLRSIN